MHDFLFASRHEYEDKKKLLKADDRRKRDENFNKSYVTQLSSKLIDHARRRKSAEIFLALLPMSSSDEEVGDHTQLDTSCARYTNLPNHIDNELKNVVLPMLQRLNGASITFDEFSTLLDRELEDTTNGPIMSILVHNKGRSVSLETTKKKLEAKAKKDMTFKPKINKKSIEIANALGRGESATMPIYDLLHKHQRRYKMNLEMQQKKQIEKEMTECTFRPKLVSSSAQYGQSMYSRLPGAYVSPTKSSTRQSRDKANVNNTSYQQPDVWTPNTDDTSSTNRSNKKAAATSSGNRLGTHRGPSKVFGRRVTVGTRDGFLGLDTLVAEQNEVLKMKKVHEKSDSSSSGGGSTMRNNPTIAKVKKTQSVSPAVTSPSAIPTTPSAASITPAAASSTSKNTPSMKGGGGSSKKKKKKKLAHSRSATLMHPPPEELNRVEVEEQVETVSVDDMNDIDRVLAELRSVTKEDDQVGYTSK